jgi:exopolysaccharide biosynthesis polyprenyl glycosylphosphotransferase
MKYADIQLTLPVTSPWGNEHLGATKGRHAEYRQHVRRTIALSEPLLDGLAAAGAVQLAWMISTLAHGVSSPSYGQPGSWPTLAFALVVLVLLERGGAYHPAKSMLFVRETAIVMAVSCSVAATLWISQLAGCRIIPAFDVPINAAMLFLLLLIEKTCVHGLQQRLHERGVTALSVALCGAGTSCGRLFSTLVNSPKLGLWPRVLVDPCAVGPSLPVVENSYRTKRSVRVMHEPLDCEALRHSGVEKVLILASSFTEVELANMLRQAAASGMAAEVCAGDVASAATAVEWVDIDGIMIWRPRADDCLSLYRVIKRGIDLLGSAILLTVLAPVFAIISVAIQVSSPGDVLFRQERIGRGGRRFTMLKFRSMHQHACGDELSPRTGADSRISGIGRFLRKTSLDELPQLLNVLTGEMSLVGPRPEMPFLVDGYTPLQMRRLEVLPGITGLWQLSAHRKDLIHNNMQYDLYYVRHRNCFLDMAILVHTLLFAMKGV